jgi:hypothetical protein
VTMVKSSAQTTALNEVRGDVIRDIAASRMV